MSCFLDRDFWYCIGHCSNIWVWLIMHNWVECKHKVGERMGEHVVIVLANKRQLRHDTHVCTKGMHIRYILSDFITSGLRTRE